MRRRSLAHFETRDKVYFVTFCSRDRQILTPEARTIVLRQIIAFHQVLFFLITAVVMPDHVHVLLVPLELSLVEIMKKIKGGTARSVNQRLGQSGSLWQRDYFDRQMRGDEDVRAKGEYIAHNPVRAGLVATPEEYPWLWRAWVESGCDWR